MLLRGMATIVSGVDVSTAGAPLYISTTAGSMTSTIPSSADDYVRILGYTLAYGSLEMMIILIGYMWVMLHIVRIEKN